MTDVCVIFDLDSALIDSERLCKRAFVDLEKLAGVIHGSFPRQTKA